MTKEKSTKITLKEGSFTIDEMAIMLGKSRNTVKTKPKRVLEELQYHCIACRRGSGEEAIFTLSNVPNEPIPKKDFGKDSGETRKERSDKGISRKEYNTIKEQFKPLIYRVLTSNPGYAYTATFNNWLRETELVEEEFIKERIRAQEECFYNDFTKDFISTEGDSLRRCFIGALDSMSKSKLGKVAWYKRRIAINLEDDHIELGERETAEVENIEQELLNLFEVSSRNELIYKSRKRLREFDLMFGTILMDRYGYKTCYVAYQVIAKLGVNKKTINKNLEQAKKLYGIVEEDTQDIQDVILACKDKIYRNRLKRAKSRYSERKITREKEINERYDKELVDNWGDDDFVEFLRNMELSDDYPLEDYIEQWVEHYRQYIHSKI